MGGITLERSEFLVLMDAVEATAVVGLDTDELLPAKKAQHKALIEKGIDLLRERGVLRTEGDLQVLDEKLLGMALIIADPQLALITTRDNPGKGQQLFLHYVAEQVVVEQTLPTDHEHRLALVGDRERAVERLLDILPVASGAKQSQAASALDEKSFLGAKNLAEAGSEVEAREMLEDRGMPGEAAESLANALAEPEFGGTIALLRCSEGEIVDARNLAVVQGGSGVWIITPASDGTARYEIQSGDAKAVKELIVKWMRDLSE